MTLKNGTYTLEFDWAAFENKALSTSLLEVYFNGKLVHNFYASSYEIHHESFTVNGVEGPNTLKVVGGGPADSFGASIDNFRLIDCDVNKKQITKSVHNYIVYFNDEVVTFLNSGFDQKIELNGIC